MRFPVIVLDALDECGSDHSRGLSPYTPWKDRQPEAGHVMYQDGELHSSQRTNSLTITKTLSIGPS